MDPTNPLHVAVIPYPGRGHINPMLNLCRSLLLSSSKNNLLISFVATEEWVHLITTSSTSPFPPTLRFLPIPDVLPSERTRGADFDFAAFSHAVQTEMEGPIEAAMTDDAARPKVDLVVADAGLPWAADICRRKGLPVAALWTQSAAVLLAFLRFGSLDRDGQLPVDFPGKDDEALAYIPRVASPHLASMLSNIPDNTILRYCVQIYSWFSTSQSLLLSSTYDLESQIIDNLNSVLSLPIYAIGPSIPYMTLSDPPIETDTKHSYIKWLDSQPSCSVLYISLGSFLSASTAQVDEMVMGLEASDARYLWASRDEHLQSKELGMVVPWCDQLRVLCHPSVGGFLTHCGWNSTLEGVYAGVPMLTYPLIWDQYPNSKQIVDDWKIGLRLKDEEAERVIEREEVAKMVLELMDLEAEENKQMRRRSAQLKEQCRKAVGGGGSSSTSLDAFVQEMINQKESISA